MITMLNKKSFSRTVSIGMSALVLVSAGLLAGCATRESSQSLNSSTVIEKSTAVTREDVQGKVMADFKVLLDSNPKADAVLAFIDKNVSNVSKENASTMISGLEEIQKKCLPGLEEKYFNGETIQIKMNKVYKTGFDLNKIDDIEDKDLKNLLVETRDTGYKVETAEGTYFPIMNYEYYKKYSSYVTADIKDYIDIMAVESNKVPAKDAALMIGWDEILKRALAQEQFIKNHGSSAKAGEIKQLQKKYITFMLYGTNNTPLFSYDSKVIVQDAKTAYLNAVKNSGDSDIMKMLREYSDILGKTGYKFSDTADKFRKDAVESITF